MSVQVEKLEKNMAKLTVEVPAEEVEKALQAAVFLALPKNGRTTTIAVILGL